INDSLIMLASYPGDLEFVFRKKRGGELTVVDYDKMFLWDQVLQRWKELDTTVMFRLDSIIDSRFYKYKMRANPNHGDYYYEENPKQGWEVDFDFKYSDNGTHTLVVKKANGEDSLLLDNKIPYDCNIFSRYPITTIDKERLIMLGSGGVYELNTKRNETKRLGEKGLIASDITRIIQRGKAVYAVVGREAIWKYSDGKWQRLIHVYDDLYTQVFSVGAFDEKSVDVSEKGEVFFTCYNHAFIIGEDGKVVEIGKDQKIIHAYFSDSDKLIVIRNDSKDNSSLDYSVCEFSVSTNAIIREITRINEQGSCFMKVSDTTSLYMDGGTIDMVSAKFHSKLNWHCGSLEDRILVTGMHSTAFIKEYYRNSLRIYNEKANGWAEIFLDSLHTLSAVTITADGKIIYATNYRHDVRGCDMVDYYMGQPHLYYMHFNGKSFESILISNPVNPRILTLQADKTDPNLIYVGTSGSGLYELRLEFK
ncbi:MAG: hypothetical protein ACHQF2_05825, partial [Flavobacteriales bacterium]